jgi:hypothetical protein
MTVLPDSKIKCPYTSFKQSCRTIVAKHDCPKFVTITGINPNNGQPVDQHGCIDSFMGMLLIENSQQSRQTGAAVESFRNEVVKALGNVKAVLLPSESHELPRISGDT